MPSKSKNSYAIIVIVLIALPICFLYFINIDNVTNYLKCNLSMEPHQLFESSINYLSLAATILLGIIVYKQEQKINDLQSSQYEVFLGVVGLDNEYSIGDFLLAENYPSSCGFLTVHSFGNSAKCFLTSLQFDSPNNQNFEVIPLVFLVKSYTLITGIHFEKISMEIFSRTSTHFQKEFESKDSPIYEVFEDAAKFSLGVGIALPEEVEIDEIKFVFSVTINDQICRVHKKQIEVKLKKINDEYLISSSKTS